jgi:hypothetical protein
MLVPPRIPLSDVWVLFARLGDCAAKNGREDTAHETHGPTCSLLCVTVAWRTHASKAKRHPDNGVAAITVVVLQEAWAHRCGIFWPFVWAWKQFERLLIRYAGNCVRSYHEAFLYKAIKAVFFGFFLSLFNWFFQQWIPGLRRVRFVGTNSVDECCIVH